MGQRLNIEIRQKGEDLANCYYHWSGYTSSAIRLTLDIIYSMTKETIINETDLRRKAILLLSNTGAGLAEEQATYAKDFYDINLDGINTTNVDRNSGLIGITEDEMSSTRRWSEADVFIDIADKTVDFAAFWCEDIDEYNQDAILKMSKLDHSFNQTLSFEDFSKLANKVSELIEQGEYHFVDSQEQIIGFIE